MTTAMATAQRVESTISEDPPDPAPVVFDDRRGSDEAAAFPGAIPEDRYGARPSRRSAPLGLIGEQAPLATGPRPPEFIPRTASVLADALGIERPSVVLSRESMDRAGDLITGRRTEAPVRTTQPSGPSIPPLGQVLTRLRLRPVPEPQAPSLDREIVTGTVVHGYREAVWMAIPGEAVEGRWVTTSDLAAWMVDSDMILDVCRGHARDVAEPSVSIVLDPAGRQILVLESDTPDAVALLPHLDRHLRLAPGAEALAALANDHVIVAHTYDGVPPADMTGLLLDTADREHARRPGMAIPALYRWTDAGPELVTARLDTAAGRLIADMATVNSPT